MICFFKEVSLLRFFVHFKDTSSFSSFQFCWVRALDAHGLPAFRKVQEADEEALLDELGSYLRSVQHLGVGPVPKDRRTDLLKEVVDFFYRELAKLVASLKPDGLLEWLVSRHETIVHEAAYHHLTMPTRLACFSETPGMIDELRKEIPERSKAGVASRFIIEYVVARPPSGLRSMSLSVYDRLQALASQIITFGFESDLIYFQLADLDLELLPSGRLGTDREQYEKALEAYLTAFATGEIARATNAFGRYWANKRIASEKPDLARELDSAALGEFGH